MVRGKCQPFAALLIALALATPLSAQVVRRSANSREAERMLASYARAIEVMRRLPANDPHSWTFQANLHGYPAGTPRLSPLWGQCQHGQWWFLPWHRAYQHAFEKIIRVHSGDPTFALPYWNWSDPGSRTLPARFRNANSPLYDPTRRSAVNSGRDFLDTSVAVSDANYALSRPAFFSFSSSDARDTFGGLRVSTSAHSHFGGGAVESSPHNYIHGWIGGNMQDPDRAARDPIFHLHHANIDRLWELWLTGPNRQNPSDAVWLNQRFTLYDENKRPFTIAVRDLLNTHTQLNYVYDNPSPRRPAAKPGKDTAARQTGQRSVVMLEPQKPWGTLGRDPMQIALRLDDTQAAPLKQLAKKDKVAKGELILLIEGITYEAPVADSALEVYLSISAGAAPSSDKRRHLADRCAFFGAVHHGAARFRLGEAFEQLRTQDGFRPEALTLTLTRHWFGDDAPANPGGVTFTRVSLQVEQ